MLIRFLLAASREGNYLREYQLAALLVCLLVSMFDDSSSSRLHIGTRVEVAVHACTNVPVASSLSRIGLHTCILTIVTSLLVGVMHATDQAISASRTFASSTTIV